MTRVLLILGVAVAQVAVMYFGYGGRALGIPFPAVAALIFVAAPLAAGLVQFRLLESSGVRPRSCFAAAAGTTLVAASVGVFLAVNSFGT